MTHFFALFALLCWKLLIPGLSLASGCGDLSPPRGVSLTSPAGEGSSSSKTCFNDISGHSPSLPALACPCTEWSSHWQDAGPRSRSACPGACPDDRALSLSTLGSSHSFWVPGGVFLAFTCFAEWWQPPWCQGQTSSQFVLSLSDSEVSGQPASPVVLRSLQEVSHCLGNLTFTPQ